MLTFAREEQVVGWPCFTVEAPAGTVIEILVHEAHRPHTSFLMNTHFNSWTRFICREGFEHHVAANFSTIASPVYEAATRYLGWDMHYHEDPNA